MKNSLITIITIITALTFYSCSDEDDIKTEPEKSIEDCLEFIYVVEDEYIFEGPFIQSDEYKNIKVDTCSFEYLYGGNMNVSTESLIFYYIDAVLFEGSSNLEEPFFDIGNKELTTDNISSKYLKIKDILSEFENNNKIKFTFIKQNDRTHVKINNYISSETLKDINEQITKTELGSFSFYMETLFDYTAEMEGIK